MRFFQSAVLALALVGSIVGVSAKKHHDKKHHDVLHSKQQITENMAHDMFTAFMKQYSKKYSHEEFSGRFQTFKANLEKIRQHNTMVNSTFTMGLNEFADLTFAEFKAKYFGYKKINREFDRANNYASFEDVDAPASVDWRTVSNVLTPVKNQGQCGSCWAFSTTGSVEAAYNIKNKPSTPINLSEQQLVDCSTSYGNNGCNGGLMDNAFKYIIANGGLCSESDYAYTGAQGTCNTSCENVATITTYKDVTPSNTAALKAAIALGPVSIAIEADQSSFQFYSSGEITSGCGQTLDHGVLAVGYGTDATGATYWIVKNSWGASWGQAGYVYIQDGQCGVKLEPSYPVA